MAETPTTNPEPIALSESDLLWLAVYENGGDLVIPVEQLLSLPKDRSVSVAFTDDRSLLVITASGGSESDG